MAGAGSALDRNDYQLLDRLNGNIARLADGLERLNDNLEEGPDADHRVVRRALEDVLGDGPAEELLETSGGPLAALAVLREEGSHDAYLEAVSAVASEAGGGDDGS